MEWSLTEGLKKVWTVSWVHHPQGALAKVRRFLHLAETLVKGEVMPHRVLPSSRSISKIREVVQDPGINVFHRQGLIAGVLDRHEDEAGEGIWRFGIDVDLRVVRDGLLAGGLCVWLVIEG